MHKMFQHFTSGLLFFLFIFSQFQSAAAIKLPSLIGNNMVLQQNAIINVWGWADAGEKVSVKASWPGTAVETITSTEGNWKTTIKTPAAGGPFMMTISGRDYSITLENVLIGEVWVCSGQSNMDFTIKALSGWNFYKPEVRDEVKIFTSVRLFTVQKDTSASMQNDCKGNWKTADTNSVKDFSATAWFFGSYLSKKLGVPVGLIVSAWGGTPAEVWTPVESIKAEPDLGFYLTHYNGSQWWPGTPGVLFNAMIHPLLNYTIKGAIWYQGESNRMDARLYPKLMNTMIASWRKAWAMGDFPFYFVQIAPYNYNEPFAGALLREAQLKCISIPNTGMAVTMDLVDNINDIHPKNKLDVGKRLALWALNKTYAKPEGSFSGPIFKGFNTSGKSIILEFSYADKGLKIVKAGKNNFTIADTDHVFFPATVEIQGTTLIVSSPKVKQPKAVRYAFTNTSEATLFNGKGLPASSFRTDDWDIITENASIITYKDSKTRLLSYQLTSKARESDIYYAFNSPPGKNAMRFLNPIPAGKSGVLYATVSRNGFLAGISTSWKIISNKASAGEISYQAPFSQKYSAGGNQALIDGIIATDNLQDGNWQGFDGSDLDAIIDLQKSIKVNNIKVNFLSDNNTWIFLPKKVSISISEDGVTYKSIGESRFSSEKETKNAFIQPVSFKINTKIRFIRLVAQNQGICPEWHSAKGKKCWLFADEIVVE